MRVKILLFFLILTHSKFLFSSDFSILEKGGAEAFSLYPLIENASIYNPSAITYHKRISIIPLRVEIVDHGDFFEFVSKLGSKLTPSQEDLNSIASTKKDQVFHLKSTAGFLKDHLGIFIAMDIKSHLLAKETLLGNNVYKESELSFKTSMTYGFLLFKNLRLGASIHGIYSLRKSQEISETLMINEKEHESFMSLTKGTVNYVDLALDLGALWPIQLSKTNYLIPSLAVNHLFVNVYQNDEESYDKTLIPSKQTKLSFGTGFKSNLPVIDSSLILFYNYELGFAVDKDIVNFHKSGFSFRSLEMFYFFTGVKNFNLKEPSFSFGYYNRFVSLGVSRFYETISPLVSSTRSNPLWGYFLRFSYQIGP